MNKAIQLAIVAIALLFCNSTKAQTNYPLQFPKDKFTLETKKVKTTMGEVEITYRAYMHIPYVANPIDKDYQSLNVFVPVKIDSKDTDASNAPILFEIAMGGYMSVSNAEMREGNQAKLSYRADLALTTGFVVISPGCRGRDNRTTSEAYFGKAPSVIVDLKAAVRYIRFNKGVIPGNVDWIVSVGCSAGGAVSALLGTSGNSTLYDIYLKKIGAANASDNIFASACYSPITDLEHADMAYEWMFGEIPNRSGLADQKLSKQLAKSYSDYQKSLELKGRGDFGMLTAQNYQDYLVRYFLSPSASRYLKELPDSTRNDYLKKNNWITWKDNKASFKFKDYVSHVGRMKGLPAFDDFDKNSPENILFGSDSIDARHFTNFSLQHLKRNKKAEIDKEIMNLTNLMNAFYFAKQENKGCAQFWWLRNGTSDNHTSQTVMINLATKLQNINKDVNAWLFWDGGHCADYDPEGFIEWIKNITGYRIQINTIEK